MSDLRARIDELEADNNRLKGLITDGTGWQGVRGMSELRDLHNDSMHSLRKDIEDLKTDNERLRALLRDVFKVLEYDDYWDGWGLSKFMTSELVNAIREAVQGE